jgi:hypothetical protein
MHLHLLSFTIPYPADYGGVIDVFEKIRALHAEGVQIHLHCFVYDRPEAPELEAYCAEVHYYKRRTSFSGGMPYIVSSRRSEDLLHRLGKDDYPILAEGIHTSYALIGRHWPGRVTALRLHNVEATYYKNLALVQRSGWRALYLKIEGWLLSRWEKKAATLPLLAIHPGVKRYYEEHYGAKDVTYLPAFTSYAAGTNPTGRGDYVLVHGDLSVRDNVESLQWLLEEVRRGPAERLPWVVAGRKPDARTRRLLQANAGVRLVEDPGAEEMEALIRGAQVHLIQSFNPEGIKIKLLHALFLGRHCIAHARLLEGTGLEETCKAAADAGAFKTHLEALWPVPFTEADKAIRTKVLQQQFDNRVHARKLIARLGGA